MNGGYRCWWSAAADNDFDWLMNLLRYKADVNAAGADGTTALIAASLHGHAKIAEELLARWGRDERTGREGDLRADGHDYPWA